MQEQQAFPIKADLKVQIIKVLDILGVASKLCEIRDKYKELTGINANLRETLRNLNKHEIVKLMQPKNSIRGLYWIKTDWLDANGNLQDKYRFNGFELIYTDDAIEFK